MLPTLLIPAAIRAEPLASTPVNTTADAPSDADGFAGALQRAQGGPTAAVGDKNGARVTLPHGGEPPGKAAKPDDGKPAVRAGGKGHDADRPRVADHARHDDDAHDDAQAIDPDVLRAGSEQLDSETTTAESPATPNPLGDAPTSPPIAIDTVLPPGFAHDVARGTTATVQSDGADDAIAVTAPNDHRAPGRFTVRMGAHDVRAAAESVQAGDASPPRATASRADDVRAIIDSPTAAIAAARPPAREQATIDAVSAATSIAASNGPDPTPGHDKVAAHASEVTLHAGIDETEFGNTLGGQVALWVREGVQEARLHLHPAELGPVNVQIALDGQLAHVDFVAAVPATRESIEQSLPALAAALRESGFTLAGGGVSGHGAHGGHGGRHGGAGREFGTPQSGGDDATSPVVTPRRWSRSLVDVYA